MYEDLPFPPNWESRFDPNTQQWFFVDHVNKRTSWDDPRPAYYSAMQKRNSVSNDRTVTATPSPTLDTSYASLGSDYGKVNQSTSSPQPDESDEREEQFMEYLQALRAAYPDYKDRQLAKLMEKWLGDSPSLRKFIAIHMKRKVSSSSEATTKRASVTSSGKPSAGGSLKRNDPLNTVASSREGYEEISDQHLPASQSTSAKRESLSPDTKPSTSDRTKPLLYTGITSSAATVETSKIETSDKSISNNCSPRPVSDKDSAAKTNVRNEKDPLPEYTTTNSHQQSTVNQQTQSSQSSVVRCLAKGPNPQLRGPRVVARGPDRQLARGPDRSLSRGPDRTLLLRWPHALNPRRSSDPVPS